MSGPRLLGRRAITLIMGSGLVVMMAAVLDLIRPMVEGPLANMIPNLPLTPAAFLAGGVAVVAGAVARRRIARHPELSSPRPNVALEPKATAIRWRPRDH